MNIKLTKSAPLYLEKFSNSIGYDLKFESVKLDMLFRLSLNGVKLTDPSDTENPPVLINSIIVEPRIFSSLFNRKVNLEEIIIENPVIKYDSEDARKLLKAFKKGEQGGDKPPAVTIERIKLEDARFELGPDFTVLSREMEILISDAGSEWPGRVDFEGGLTIKENELGVQGGVSLLPEETTGNLKISLDRLKTDSFPGSVKIPRHIEGVSELEFRVSEDINVGGNIVLMAETERLDGPLAAINYELRYDPTGNTAFVNALKFELLDTLEGEFTGTVEEVTGSTIFNLNGSAATESLKEIVKWVPEINENELAGSLYSDDLRITGSRKDQDISLRGKITLDRVNFADKDDGVKVKDLSCGLNIEQGLAKKSDYSFSSWGDCALGTFYWDELGEVDGVSGNVEIKPEEEGSGYRISLSKLDGRYMDGRVHGSLDIIPAANGIEIGGRLSGENLNLKKAPKNILPFNMEGDARQVSADFKGRSGNYDAGITFAVNDFLLRSDRGREFKISKVSSGEVVRFEYISAEEGEDKDAGSSAEQQKRIIISDKGLDYEDLSSGEYHIRSGKVSELIFSLNIGGDWSLIMNSRGSGFEVIGKEIGLDRFKEHLEIENSGKQGFSGMIDGQGGRFKSVNFPMLSAEYVFKGDSLDINKLSAEIGTIGEFRTDELLVGFGGQNGGYPYRIGFDDGSFTAFDDKLKSAGIKGVFILHDPERGSTEWEGEVSIKNSDIFSTPLTDLSFGLLPYSEGIKLTDISGNFLDGDLIGKVDILTSQPGTGIVTDLSLHGASVKSGDSQISLSRSDFYFSGTLPDGSLPAGKGKLELKEISLGDKDADSTIDGAVEFRTAGETLSIDNGFIGNKESGEIVFSGEMKNSLSEERRLELAFPGVALSSAVTLLRPFMPQDFRNGQASGVADLRLELRNLFSPGSSWGGDITFNGASYSLFIGGADLFVRDINGTIRLKEQAESENALASILGDDLEFDKKVYRKYFSTLKEARTGPYVDYLKIGEIEYGILKFEDVECELEVDREKLNLERLKSRFFLGTLYGTGILNFESPGVDYNFSFLFNDVSLEGISKRLSSIKDYITGRVNGLIWLSGEGAELGTIDGPFEFWVVKSDKEARVIGKALLDQLGAKERFILGSTRSYDNGEISGYIKDGVITFQTLDISNTILGYKNLSIQADPIRNSISISHLVSVIREIARRSRSGGPTIETN
ncbi:MAG: hypothetical protein RIG61_00575 [Deltaproteobacteria bacterium]